jgi:8-oxo-dGTP diphosphatase
MSSEVIRVVGAAIVKVGRVFCAQRGAKKQVAGKWEFPGGKIEAGESPQQALVREIHEELGCTVSVGRRVETTDNAYSFGTVELSTYYCRLAEGEPQLTEHQDARWEKPSDMPSLDWAPADIPAMREISVKTPDQLEELAR